MNRRLLIETTILAVVLVPGMLAVSGRESAAEDQTCALYQGQYVPVADLAQAIKAFLEEPSNAQAAERPVVVAEPVTNSLMIRGRPQVVKRIHQMIVQLDRKPSAVFVEAVIVSVESAERPARVAVRADGGTTADELIEALSKQGRLQVLARAQLMALDNQAACLQIGRRRPNITGVRRSSDGVSRSVERENVGLSLGLTPRVTPEGTVVMEADLERSDLDAPERGVELTSDGDRTLGITTLSLQTTVCARSGQTVVLGGLTEGSGGKWQKLVALLTPQIIK
jgi:general secretion pathway protein D